MKIKKREAKDKTIIAVLDYNDGVENGLNPESWEFFEKVSNGLIHDFSLNLKDKNDGPDSSRWIYSKNAKTINFEYDDMIGTTIIVYPGIEYDQSFISEICNYLTKMS